MRFFLLLVVAAAIGASSGVAALIMLPQQSTSMLAAVQSLGPSLARFRFSDLNPVRAAYDDVARKITTGEASKPFDLPSRPVVVGTPIQMPNPFVLDQEAIRRAQAAGAASRFQQSYQRSQAINQYSRNPIGWHGPRPH